MPSKAKPLPPGVYTPVITLYDDTPLQPVNLDGMYKQCQYLVNSGLHGLVYLGTNGELALLTHEERQSIIRMARRAVTDMGLPDYPIVAGISAQSTVETIQFAREAAEAGAGWGLLLPPSYWAKALSSDALVGYYRDVADASPIPIVVYNVSPHGHDSPESAAAHCASDADGCNCSSPESPLESTSTQTSSRPWLHTQTSWPRSSRAATSASSRG